MTNKIKVAAIQLTANGNKERNVNLALDTVDKAVDQGAELVVIPEMFNCYTDPDIMIENAEPIPGYTTETVGKKAKENGIYIICGIYEKAKDNRAYNTSVAIGPDGNVIDTYSKSHLFDIDVPGSITYFESKYVARGNKITNFPIKDFKCGMTVCYDLRFPELFRIMALEGASIFAMPCAFTHATGQFHWDALIKARAIENQTFVVAANQVGKHPNNIVSYGNSMIVDPWGRELAHAQDNDNLILAELDFDLMKKAREEMPLFKQRRVDLYSVNRTK